MLTLDQIYRASYILRDVASMTRVIKAHQWLAPNTDLYFKTENLQVTGSFKVRGAYNKIAQLTDAEKAAGIVACSAGNHAQGVALAAARMGAKAIICMPDGAPISKVEATKSYGAEVRLVPTTYDDAQKEALRIVEETGATLVHPFDDEAVMAGQGTIGMEIMEQLPEVEAVIVPVGGGGLISGVAYAIKQIKPSVKVYGVQAALAPSAVKSLASDKLVQVDSVATFADGIAVKMPSQNTFNMMKQYVDDVVTVTEDEIAAAILALMERQKLVTEGAGAVAAAAAIFNRLPIEGKKTCALLSGGNIDVNILSRVITRGLVTGGRMATVEILLDDRPGQLTKVSQIISDCGANVVSVLHERSGQNMALASCVLKMGLETRNREQIEQIENTLRAAGFQLVNHGNMTLG